MWAADFIGFRDQVVNSRPDRTGIPNLVLNFGQKNKPKDFRARLAAEGLAIEHDSTAPFG
jgi:hypothetical protein